MNKIIVFVLPLLIVSSLWGSTPTFSPCSIPEVEEPALCSVVEVFENRAEKGRKIPLHVAVLKATGVDKAGDPLLVLAGGPGQAATELGGYIAEHFPMNQINRDLVFVDVRGTGDSNPLTCNLYGTGIEGYFGDLFPVEQTRQCLKELEQHADLKFYTTPEIVKDLEEVRIALGIEKWNLYGTSYGTRVALLYMRMYPDALRSVILHGSAPTNLKAPLYHAWAGQQSLEDIFRKCAADEACHNAFPNIRSELDKILKDLDQSVPVEITDPASEKAVKVRLTRGVFGEALRNMLYNPESAGRVPLLIHKASTGDYTTFAEFNLFRRKAFQEYLSIGLFHSVSCAEDVPLITNEEIKRETQNTFLQDYRIRQQQHACSVWPRASVPEKYNDPVRSTVPALVVTGEFDPVTPPRIAKEVAEYLSNSRNLIVPGASHSGGGVCLDGIMAAFIREPDPKKVSDSCLSKHEEPLKFEIP